MRRVAFLFVFLGSLAGGQASETVSGLAQVIDGDTLDIRGIRVRLHAVDAPESAQTCRDGAGKVNLCGSRAAFALEALVKNRVVTCTRKDTDRYGRMVAVCQAAGVDVGRSLVRQGWAVAFTQYGRDYVQAELEAKTLKAGLWAGAFQRPEAYRAARRSAVALNPPSPSAPAPVEVPVPERDRSHRTVGPLPGGKCPSAAPIKGNITSKGRIYHLPGQASYAATKAEACFTSEVDARAAGFRAVQGR